MSVELMDYPEACDLIPVRVRGYLDGGRVAEEGTFWPHQTGEGGFYWEYMFFGGHLALVNASGGHKGRAHDPKKPPYLAICRKQLGQKGRDNSFFVVSDNDITAIVDGKS
jgi:hypothetical protein